MSVYVESGVQVTPTDLEHHRFSDLPAYKALKGQHLKEVDFCWFQPTDNKNIKANTLVGLELKGCLQSDLPVDKLFNNLIEKIRDTLSMLSAAWLGMGEGANLRPQLPASYQSLPQHGKIKLVMLVNVDESQTLALKALREKLKNKARGIEKLYGITVTLCDLATAQKMGLPVEAAT